MIIKGLKKLTASDIENKTEEIISKWFSETQNSISSFPLNDFCCRLENDHKVKFVFDADLGFQKNGKKILGCFLLNPWSIFIDSTLKNDVRFPFVLAHEIGHLILHRKVTFSKDDYESIIDIDESIVLKEGLVTDVDFMEWQANYFASSLLMPRNKMKYCLISAQKSIGINSNLGKIFRSNAAYSLNDFNSTIEILAKIFCVSKTNVEYRLLALGLIEDKRKKISTLKNILSSHAFSDLQSESKSKRF